MSFGKQAFEQVGEQAEDEQGEKCAAHAEQREHEPEGERVDH